MVQKSNHSSQKCIPVGYVPPAAVAVCWGVCPVHAGITLLGPGPGDPLPPSPPPGCGPGDPPDPSTSPLPGVGLETSPARPLNLPLDVGLETHPLWTDRHV